jgi:pimeloyl-ACP methyl ester carboxylesterase
VRARLVMMAAVLAMAPTALPLAASAHATAASGCLSSLPQVQQVAAGHGTRSGSTPVLFVHGINSGPAVWGPTTPDSVSRQAAAIPGVTAWTYGYAQQSLDWVTTQQVGPDLATAITCLTGLTGRKVVIVGDSTGGLAAQYALGQDHGQVAADTAEVITIGTPYEGSALLSYLQELLPGDEANKTAGGSVEEAAFAEALLSACAGMTTSQLDTSPCWLVSVPRSPADQALEGYSARIAALPRWPADVRVIDIAGDVEFRIGAGRVSFSKNFGDVAVPLASATAYHTAGPPVIRYCTTNRTLLDVISDPGPCFYTSLPYDPVIVAAVLAAIRSNVTPP